ncbi:MAG: inositol monophosphatase [Deltaproteobacteria bacterium]|nr:inositol monophosphatase [Deltaproteobacteria bacterium]
MDIKATAVNAAKKAGLMLRERLGSVLDIEYKGVLNLVTEMDKLAEDAIISEIRKAFPSHSILTEESGKHAGEEGYRWIIDPLDGTTNYAHGLPFFCVSIGFEAWGQVTHGVVFNPMLNELFYAQKGKGAYLNGEKIRVSKIDNLNSSLLATGFPYDIRSSKNNNLERFKKFALKAQAIRRAGSAALDLCYTACGRFDGFWEIKLKPWDTAAACLMVEEAGGMVTDFSGGPFDMDKPECLASNRLIHEEMLKILGKRAE